MFEKRPIHQSLLRSQSFLGCDRELTMFLVFITLTISLSTLNLKSCLLGLISFITGFFFLHLMAKNDLLLRKIYLRYFRYKKFYLAQGIANRFDYRG